MAQFQDLSYFTRFKTSAETQLIYKLIEFLLWMKMVIARFQKHCGKLLWSKIESRILVEISLNW